MCPKARGRRASPRSGKGRGRSDPRDRHADLPQLPCEDREIALECEIGADNVGARRFDREHDRSEILALIGIALLECDLGAESCRATQTRPLGPPSRKRRSNGRSPSSFCRASRRRRRRSRGPSRNRWAESGSARDYLFSSVPDRCRRSRRVCPSSGYRAPSREFASTGSGLGRRRCPVARQAWRKRGRRRDWSSDHPR